MFSQPQGWFGLREPSRAFSAIVRKDGSTVWAEDASGKTIASGEAGVDDASVIQSAIDSVANAGGGKVFIRAGTYIIPEVPDGGSAIRIKSNVEVSGERWNTLLKLADNVSLTQISNLIILEEESCIADLSIDGNKSGAPEAANYLDCVCLPAPLARAERIYVKNSPRYGIRPLNTKAVAVIECIGEGCHASNFMPTGLKNGIIANCISRFSEVNGISCDNIKYCDIIGNVCYENTGAGIRIAVSSEGCSVVGNACYNNVGPGIRLDGPAYRNTISGNVCWGNTYGINIERAKYNLVSANICLRNCYGIRIHESSYNLIEGNYVLENYEEGDPSGGNILFVGDNHYNTIKNNVVKIGEGERSTECGILISEWTPANTNNFIIDNDVTNGGASFNIKDKGIDTVIKRNLGYPTENSGTATFSGDGTTTQFSIAHGLVKAPTKVQVTPMTADAASDFYVTADDTNIYINYKSAPPSGTDNLKFSWYAEV